MLIHPLTDAVLTKLCGDLPPPLYIDWNAEWIIGRLFGFPFLRRFWFLLLFWVFLCIRRLLFFVGVRRLCLGGFCLWLFWWSLRRGWRWQLGFGWLFLIVLRLLSLICRCLWLRTRVRLAFLGLRWLRCWRFRQRRFWCALAWWLVICLLSFEVSGWIVYLLWFSCLVRLCFRSSMIMHRGFVLVLGVGARWLFRLVYDWGIRIRWLRLLFLCGYHLWLGNHCIFSGWFQRKGVLFWFSARLMALPFSILLCVAGTLNFCCECFFATLTFNYPLRCLPPPAIYTLNFW